MAGHRDRSGVVHEPSHAPIVVAVTLQLLLELHTRSRFKDACCVRITVVAVLAWSLENIAGYITSVAVLGCGGTTSGSVLFCRSRNS